MVFRMDGYGWCCSYVCYLEEDSAVDATGSVVGCSRLSNVSIEWLVEETAVSPLAELLRELRWRIARGTRRVEFDQIIIDVR